MDHLDFIQEKAYWAKSLTPQQIRAICELAETPLKGSAAVATPNTAWHILCRAWEEISRYASEGETLIGASGWVLDHYPYLEESAHVCMQNIRKIPRLPALKSTGAPRSYELAREMIGSCEKSLQEETIIAAIKLYSQRYSIKMAELWYLPEILRCILLWKCALIAQESAQMQKEAAWASEWLDKGRHRLPAKLLTPAAIHRLNMQIRRDGKAKLYAELNEAAERHGANIQELIERMQRRQATLQLRFHAALDSLHMLESLQWKELFPKLSEAEEILLQEKSGNYAALEESSKAAIRQSLAKLAAYLHRTEKAVAREALALADSGIEKQSCIGFYLIGEGQSRLAEKLLAPKGKIRSLRCQRKRRQGAFWLLYGTSILVLQSLALWLWGWKALLLLLPILGFSQRIFMRLFAMLCPAKPLLKMDYSEGLPGDRYTQITSAVLLTSEEVVHQSLAHLESCYLANRQEGLSFCILGDLGDAPYERMPNDEKIEQALRCGVASLNQKYGSRFGCYLRPRIHSRGQSCYMGRERKRGALEDMNAYITQGKEGAFSLIQQPFNREDIRYVLVLDADTVIPPDAAVRMVGAMAHPLNEPFVNEGFGVLSPRMGSFPLAHMTRLQKILAGHVGSEAYSCAVSDGYQDLFGNGLYCGKGLYDVRIMQERLRGHIQDNTILSHDMLEGLFAHAGYVSDVVFYEGHPSTWQGYIRRLHRWTRGDWQLLSYLADPSLSFIDRFKIFENLRRSLSDTAAALAFVFGDVSFVFAALILQFGVPLDRNALRALLFRIITLPAHAWAQLDAAIRALYRRFISHSHLLDWVTAADAELSTRKGGGMRYIWAGPILGLGALFGPLSIFPLLLWSLSFLYVWRLNRADKKEEPLSAEERQFLLQIAQRTWHWFEQHVHEKSHFLPVDNVQFQPRREEAKHTSPTNIGLYLASCVSAMDMGLINGKELRRRIENTLASMEQMEKWHGHFYNWYDTTTLQIMSPRYISSVDSGNLLICLWAVEQAMLDTGNNDLAERLHTLGENMELAPLYDFSRNLFFIGYDADRQELSNSHYDLMASESLLLSTVAVARGDIGSRHLSALGKPLTRSGGKNTLISWSGTMFEYLMPRLFLQYYPETLLHDSAYGAVQSHRRNAVKRPWGESEAGYHAFDRDMNYQYKAFGVPGLAMRGGISDETVVAPYATALALTTLPHEAIKNLQTMQRMGWLTEEGFLEAIDYTPSRVPAGKKYAPIHSQMAHHQGMTLLALEAAQEGKILRRIAKLPSIQAIRPLLDIQSLEEPVSQRRRPSITLRRKKEFRYPERMPGQWDLDIHLLSGKETSAVFTPRATNFVFMKDIALTRWKPLSSQPCGVLVYVRDEKSGHSTRLEGKALFCCGKAVYRLAWEGWKLSLHMSVSPEDGAFLCLVEAANEANLKENELEVTLYVEPVLCSPQDDRAHPAFQDLFLCTESIDSYGIWAHRRPRNGTEWHMALAGFGGKALGQSNDRQEFFGYLGDMENPQGLHKPLRIHTSAPITPGLTLRRKLQGEDNQAAFVMLAASQKETVHQKLQAYTQPEHVRRGIEMAVYAAQAELEYKGIQPKSLRVMEKAAAQLLFPWRVGGLRAEAAQRSVLPREELWKLGVNTDHPFWIILVHTPQQDWMIREALAFCEFWHSKGLCVQTIFIDEKGTDYQQPIQDRIHEISAAFGPEMAQILVLNGDDLSFNERMLLYARSGLVVDANAGNIDTQLCTTYDYSPETLHPDTQFSRMELPADKGYLWVDNGYGGFSLQKNAYMIYRKPPQPWCNVLANEHFGSLATESEGGYTWAENGREGKLTPMSNDPVLDEKGEILYLQDKDSGVAWSFHSRAWHMQGETLYESDKEGIKAEMHVFIPPKERIKCRLIRLRNPVGERRKIDIIMQIKWQLGPHWEESAPSVVTERNGNILWARNAYCMDGTAYLALKGASLQSYTCDAMEFDRDFSQRSGCGYLPGAGMRISLEIDGGQSAEVAFLLGWANTAADALREIENFIPGEALRETHAYWEDFLATVQVDTPDPVLNLFVNRFLPYQTYACRLLGRVGFFQPGGAYGFRDQLQDCVMLAHFKPDILRKQILLCCAHQFEEGDVQHWWHPPKRGVRTHISDDRLFLPWAVSEYLRITNDHTLLSESVPFLKAEPLPPEQEDMYFSPEEGETASVLEHCVRAIRCSCAFGAHGLPLIGSGDWNDAMNRVGAQGRGESVWLGWFLGYVIQEMLPYLPTQEANEFSRIHSALQTALEEEAWDGKWYKRAWCDDGNVLGSRHSPECRIDCIAQAWAVLSGMASKERAETAMQSLLDHLFDRANGLLKLLDPPFNGILSPGYISAYVPGVRENGGQYTHGAAWAVLALCKMEENTSAWEVLNALLPFRHNADIYKAEPYVIAADVYAGEHPGRGGWTWYTGSAGWMWQAIVRGICGLQIQNGKAFLQPHLPSDWKSVECEWQNQHMSWQKRSDKN